MFDRILVPLDGTITATTALDAAERLADRWGAKIEVLTLLRVGDQSLGLHETVKRQTERIEHERQIDVRPVSYSVADDIAAEFDEVENTVVVMSTAARGRSAGIVSNIAEEVVRHIRKPMLLLGPNDEIADDWPDGPLCVCTDGSRFAESIIPFSAEWANSLDLEPLVLSVIDSSKVPADFPKAAENNAAVHVARQLEELVDDTVNYEVLHGHDAATAIVDYAEHAGASMIALATHGRSGVSRLRYGSVAMGVIRQATCPVLINRPPTDSGGAG